MPPSDPSFRRRIAFASAFVTVVALAGCQAILGIDPDAKHDAVALEDGSPNDSGSFDGTFHEASNQEGSVLDSGPMCDDNADCTPFAGQAACERAICGDAGKCEISARDGEGCGSDGTCRGYACVGSATKIAVSNDSTCAITSEGFVWCWGADPSGILGDRGSGARSTPYLVATDPAYDLTLGNAHACVVLASSTQDLVCWGSDEYGQATASDAGVAVVGPTLVAGIPPVALLSAGFGHTCIAGTSNGAWCWGDNAEGEIGAGPGLPSIVRTPTAILLPAIGALSGTWKTVCATSGSDAYCWGDNTWGQLGSSITGASSATPTPIANLGHGIAQAQSAVSLATSVANVCIGLAPSGSIDCLGNDRDGQLGNAVKLDEAGVGGSGDVPESDPALVMGFDVVNDDVEVLRGASTLVGGTGAHFCAQMRLASNFECWGNNAAGEIGDIATTTFTSAEADLLTSGMATYALGNAHGCGLVYDQGWQVECLGDGSRGQLGDGKPISAHGNNQPRPVKFPAAPGGLKVVRASQ